MSRIRSVHPGLWTDEIFVMLTPMARLFFIALWNECDDQGSFEWSPIKLKMRLLPADTANAAELLAELVEGGSVIRYEMGGRAYGAVRNFCQYQRPKKANSIYPQTEAVRNWVNTEARSTRDGGEPVGKELPTDGGKSRQRKEEGGKRKEKKEVVDDARAIVVVDPDQPPLDLHALNAEACRAAGVKRISPNAIADSMGVIREWLADGALPEEITATIATVVETATEPIHSLRYFAAAIRQTVARRENAANGRLSTPVAIRGKPRSLRGERPDPAIDLLNAARQAEHSSDDRSADWGVGGSLPTVKGG